MPPEAARPPAGARWIIIVLIAAAALAALSWLFAQRSAAMPMPPSPGISSRFAGQTGARAVQESDANIANLTARIATSYGDILDREQLSIAYLARSKLTGDFTDLARARQAVDQGIALSPPGTGPWLAKAVVDFAAHRIDDAARALDAVDRFAVSDSGTRAEASAIRADIAMARGNDAEAARLIAEAARHDRWPGLHFRQALLAWRAGDFAAARRRFLETNAAERDPTPLFRADIHLRLGELDFAQGRWDQAAKQFDAAARTLPGYWRARMRVAQMQALNGQTLPAIKAFEAIASDAKSPEAMDIVAGLSRAQGNGEASRLWAAKASAIWQARLKLLPEAAWAHAAEHELAFGNARLALGLAARNARNRPDGAGLILLAKAWIANGRADYALALCLRAARAGWVSPEQWLVRAEALSLLGRGEEVDAARAEARALNPRALERNPAFAWLDH